MRHLRRRGIPHRLDRQLDGRPHRDDAAADDGVRGVVVLLLVPGTLLRGASLLALHAHLHGDPAHLPAPLRHPFLGEGVVVRPLSGRGLLALRHLHRPLPAAERAGDQRRAVGLLPARPPLQPSAAAGGRQLPDVRPLCRAVPGRHRPQHAASEFARQDAQRPPTNAVTTTSRGRTARRARARWATLRGA